MNGPILKEVGFTAITILPHSHSIGSHQKIVYKPWEVASGSYRWHCEMPLHSALVSKLTFFEVLLDTIKSCDQNQAILVDQVFRGAHEFARLPGFINTITIRLGEISSLSMRQASRVTVC